MTNQTQPTSPQLPATLTEAVDHLLGMLSDWDDLPALPEYDDGAIECLHVSLGPYIRNKLGLWGENQALLQDCGTGHADDAYVVILNALVKRMKAMRSWGAKKGKSSKRWRFRKLKLALFFFLVLLGITFIPRDSSPPGSATCSAPLLLPVTVGCQRSPETSQYRSVQNQPLGLNGAVHPVVGRLASFRQTTSHSG